MVILLQHFVDQFDAAWIGLMLKPHFKDVPCLLVSSLGPNACKSSKGKVMGILVDGVRKELL